MILSDREIWMEKGSGRLKFIPDVEPEQIGPSSVDLRLSNEFTTFKPAVPGVETIFDITKTNNVEEILNLHGETRILTPGESFVLKPDDLVLAYTLEVVEMPNYLAARVEGRSSLARLGVSIHQTAPTIHATFEGQIRLEISHNGPYACRLHPGQRICQLVIERLGSPSQATLRSPFQQQRQQFN